MSGTPPKTLSAGHELLPTLGNDLRDLTGLHTLVYELIQNADDATEATKMVFDVRDDALVVQNDGVFSDCGKPDARDCLGVPLEGTSVRCDFHSFLKISGQAKRQKVGTTGAFGIGFTSVFQITDYPELISNGRHWVLRYDEPQSRNVHVCAGCTRDHAVADTTFLLPWARDVDSPIRRGLGVGIPEDDPAMRFLNVASECVPGAMVFLQRVKRVELCRDGRIVGVCTRSDVGSWRFVEHGDCEQTYYVLEGDFSEDAQTLGDTHASLLETDVRAASMSIAVPTVGDELRLPLHAVLPTQEMVPLGFRLSASFYPFQDRKRLKFESEGDGESEWNRAAVRGAAALFAADPEALVRDLGPEHMWCLMRAAHDVAQQPEPDTVFETFWAALRLQLPKLKVVWTADGQLARPADVLLLKPGWQDAIDVLGEFGLAAVHPSVAPDVQRVAQQIGVEELGLHRLASAISGAGITEPMPADALPGRLATSAGLDRLLSLIDDLVGLEPKPNESRDVLARCAVMPCYENLVAPLSLIAAEEPREVDLFSDLPGLIFADMERIESSGENLRRLVRPLNAHDVVKALSTAHGEDRLDAWVANRDVREVLRWLASHASELSEAQRESLRSLPIFPTTGDPQPLKDLQLPGPLKKDPLGIASTVDLTGIDDLVSFLGDGGLGAGTLSLDLYIRHLVAPAMRCGTEFDSDALDHLLDVLESNCAALDDSTIELLAELPLLPTSAGRRPAVHTYFDDETVRAVLGDRAVVALEGRRLRRLKPLLELLGVSAQPRPGDLVAAVEETISQPPSREGKHHIRATIEYLGSRHSFAARDRESTSEGFKRDFRALLRLAWMPVAGTNEWATPAETFRTEWRTAFESTGRFVELPEPVQQTNAGLLDLLGMQMHPTPDLVIAHLVNCARDGIAVAKRAYEALDRADSGDLERLRDEPCILVEKTPAIRYAAPSEVVCEPGPLRDYLHPLPPELAGFTQLAGSLEIAQHPRSEHAIRVLQRIGASADESAAADGEIAAVEACWRILETALNGESTEADYAAAADLERRIEQELVATRAWPARNRVLQRPADLYIDDRPALRRYIEDSTLALLVDRPRFGSIALERAGLRPLSAAIAQEIVRAPNSAENEELSTLLRDREDALARVVSHATGSADALKELRRITVFSVDEMVIRRKIVGEPTIDLGEHPASAHLDKSSHRLFVRRSEDVPWTEVAVELAQLLCGDSAAGAIIEKVLTAVTASSAAEALDSLGIHRIAQESSFEPDHAGEPEQLFDDEAGYPGHTAAESADEPDEIEQEHTKKACEPDAPESTPSGATSGDVPQAPTEAGARAAQPTEADRARRTVASGREGGVPRTAGATGRNASQHARSNERKARGTSAPPWHLWVSGRRGEQQRKRAESDETTQLRAQVSAKGIARVIRYEADHGRSASEMPPNNPGFDLKSTTVPGLPPVRLIEVKSLAGSWEAEWGNAANPPQMTSEQFRLSIDEGKHWLYVVEHALDDDEWRVYPIQAVGQRASRYLLDHGWKDAADRPAGPGIDAVAAYATPTPTAPALDDVIFGAAERDDGHIPFLAWNEIARIDDPDFAEGWDAWFTPPGASGDGHFAVQQLETAMGRTLPFGSVAVFRSTNGTVPDGAVVLAQVGEGGETSYAIRRAHLVRNAQGEVESLRLSVDVPGRGDEHEFHDAGATVRVRAVYVAHQEL